MQIRTATADDAPALLDIYRPHIEKSTTSFEYELPSVAEFQQRIADTLEQYPYLVAEDNNQILGYAYAHPYGERTAYQWSAEVSVYIADEAQGKGVGRLLYETIEDILHQQNVVNVTACVTGENQNSVAFHEHMGYEVVAQFPKIGFKNGRWLDTFWLQKRLQVDETQGDENPKAFLPFRELV